MCAKKKVIKNKIIIDTFSCSHTKITLPLEELADPLLDDNSHAYCTDNTQRLKTILVSLP